MATRDYGVIAKKNGTIVNDTSSMFTDMKKTLGFEVDKDSNGNDVKGNYFIFLGDKHLYVGIYRNIIAIYSGQTLIKKIYDLSNYYQKSKGDRHRLKVNVLGTVFDIKRIHDRNRYKVSFNHKGDLYSVIYGYGVSINLDECENLYGWTENQIENTRRWILNL